MTINNVKLAVFADKSVGKKTLEFLLNKYCDDVACIVVTDKNSEVMETLKDIQFILRQFITHNDAFKIKYL